MYELSLENSERILRAQANQLKKIYIECFEIENDLLPLDILMESFEISSNSGDNISSTPSFEPAYKPSTPSAAGPTEIPPNLSTELISELIPDHVVHGSRQELEVSAEPARRVIPSKIQIIPNYLKHFELRRDVDTT
ncbi:hypothetical protein JTB14_024383 [Gonioctena quinquepunctata]|nr:hypothetical protein JTB14_024383 [Gonioctena quinquepunctata]